MEVFRIFIRSNVEVCLGKSNKVIDIFMFVDTFGKMYRLIRGFRVRKVCE